MGRFRIGNFYMYRNQSDKIVMYIGRHKGLGVWSNVFGNYSISMPSWKKISKETVLELHPDFFKELDKLEIKHGITKEVEI